MVCVGLPRCAQEVIHGSGWDLACPLWREVVLLLRQSPSYVCGSEHVFALRRLALFACFHNKRNMEPAAGRGKLEIRETKNVCGSDGRGHPQHGRSREEHQRAATLRSMGKRLTSWTKWRTTKKSGSQSIFKWTREGKEGMNTGGRSDLWNREKVLRKK